MPIIRKKLISSEVYPDTIRYNPATDTVESLVNGDWVENPAADPRTQTTLPPRLTSDTPCDAAQSVTDALKNQIDATITAVGNASTAFTIAGLILGLLTFGVFEIFIAIALTIANGMIDAGETALTAALTDPVYETLACILFCHMDSSGRLNTGELSAVEAEVSSQIGGLAATIINAMLSLAGEGGINNLASTGTSTGDCSACPCFVSCIDETFIMHGTLVAQTATSIDIQAVSVDYNGLPAFWAVYGAPDDTFCCWYCSFEVQSGSISAGGLIDCSGAGSGGQGNKRRIEFFSSAATFVIRYTFDAAEGCE